jgi:murein DD-endopeptidase MepM/ murein hydrolase activator NlpD
MQEAKRYNPSKTITISIISNNSNNPLYFKLSLRSFYGSFIAILIVIVFSLFITKNQQFLMSKMQDFAQIKATNNLQRIKVDLAYNKNSYLQDNIHKLKTQEEEIKDLLNINFDKDQTHSVNYYDYPMIYTQRIVSKKGEVGRVLIDDNIVVDYFDNSKTPTAYQRALLTAERLKVLLATKKTHRQFTIRQKGDKLFAYINNQVVFVIYPSDLQDLAQHISQRELAKNWIKNIKIALNNKASGQSMFEKFPILDRYYRKKSKLYRTIYTNINYPVHAAALDSKEEQDIRNINHSLKLAQQEMVTYKKSFTELKGTIESYKLRFEYTPSTWPVSNGFISISSFGWRVHPILQVVRFHTGMDLPTWYGAPIRATAAGTIKDAGWMGGYGRRVSIDHGYGFSTVYGHNSQLLVEPGQHVYKGQTIALAGQTGLAQGVHCHYEVRFLGRPINPDNFLNLNIFTASKNW